LMVAGVFRHGRQRFSKLSAKRRFIYDFRHSLRLLPLNIFPWCLSTAEGTDLTR
jgi:hypothetical protein